MDIHEEEADDGPASPRGADEEDERNAKWGKQKAELTCR